MPLLRVIYRSSVYAGRELTFDNSVVRVGRDPLCQVTFDEAIDRIVSRQHAEIRWDNTGPVLFPAPNRVVLLRNQKVTGPTPLAPGDILELAGPGGPSIEVQFVTLTKSKAVIGTESGVDSSAATIFQAAPFVAPAAAISNAAPAMPQAPVAAPSHAEALPEQTLLPNTVLALPADHEPPILPATLLDEGTDQNRFRRLRTIIVAVFLLVAAASLAMAWPAWLVRRPTTPKVKSARETRPEAPKPATTSVSASVPSSSAEHEAIPAPDPAIRRAYAALRRAELAVAALGPKATGATPQKKALLEQVKVTEDAYLLATQAHSGGPPKSELAELVRRTARRLGECDGAIPVGFFGEALKALATFNHHPRDGEDEPSLLVATQNALSSHEHQNLLRALADAGLPSELLFIPLAESDFRADKVGAATAEGIPKGFWQLVPGAATRFGLKVGDHPDRATIDPDDERGHFAVETRHVLEGLRAVYMGPAAGSSLLLMTTYDHGELQKLHEAKTLAGLQADDSDPERVNLWRLYESGALGEDLSHRAIMFFTWVAVSSRPEQFNLPLNAPFDALPEASSPR